jgi:uncharacterized protein YndB with AHSA1/START domain
MGRVVLWRLHTTSPPEQVFRLWISDEGREKFWAEKSRIDGNVFRLIFPDGSEEECKVIQSDPPALLEFSYFGATVKVELASDGHGGTDLTLTSTGVPIEEYEEVNAGWLSVLLQLKAAADFGIDLRNHDRSRTWRQGYIDQ